MKLVLLGTTGYHPNDRRQTACMMLPEIGVVASMMGALTLCPEVRSRVLGFRSRSDVHPGADRRPAGSMRRYLLSIDHLLKSFARCSFAPVGRPIASSLRAASISDIERGRREDPGVPEGGTILRPTKAARLTPILWIVNIHV